MIYNKSLTNKRIPKGIRQDKNTKIYKITVRFGE